MTTRSVSGVLSQAMRAFEAVTPESARCFARAAGRLPGGVTSNVKFFPPHSLYLARGEGSHVWDVDGREYVDYCLGFGPLITGHGHPRILDTIRAEIDRAGTQWLGGPSDLELRLAERLAGLLPCAEMTRFTTSGTEATMHALRLARAATGRTRMVKFEGHYHGVHDHVLWNLDAPLPARPASDGIPASTAAQTLVLPFNDRAALDALEQADDVAAVLVEPVARGVIAPDPAFLTGLREVTARRGILLVFDEIVVWPRLGLAGAQGLFGVTPDLTTLGKALGGGLPLGAVTGRRDLLALMTPRAARDAGAVDPLVVHAGTYSGFPVALAAGLATLNLLSEPGTLAALDRRAVELREGLHAIAARHGAPLQLSGRGSLVDFHFTEATVRSSRDVWASDLDRRRALDYRLLVDGIYNVPMHRYHLSLAHSTDDITRTLEAFDAELPALLATGAAR